MPERRSCQLPSLLRMKPSLLNFTNFFFRPGKLFVAVSAINKITIQAGITSLGAALQTNTSLHVLFTNE